MTILIEDLEFETIIGILEHERIVPQWVRVDCSIDYPYQNGDFINYAEAAALIEATLHKHRFELIEEALVKVASALKERFCAIETLSLAIRKPDILTHCTVGVSETFRY